MEPWQPLDVCHALSGWSGPLATDARRIGVVTGEGIGPEVIGAALDVLHAVDDVHGLGLDVQRQDVDLAAARLRGQVLPDEVVAFCEATFSHGGAVMCGPAGGRFVYEMRRRFGLFCKLTPVRPLAVLTDAGVLRPAAVAAVDLLFVRDNTGGLYFAESEERGGNGRIEAVDCRFGYDRPHVERLLGVAARLASRRRGRLAVVWKRGGIPSLSELWRQAAEDAAAAADVEVEMIDVDNACYQVVADARAFDVVAAPNMFGDVIADVSSLLLGSRGLSYSVNLGDDRVAVYQTAHGSADDLAGTDRANPVAQILSMALMLEESFGLADAADDVRRATQQVLAQGARTPDVMGPASVEVGTRTLGRRIADTCRALAPDTTVAR